MKMQWKVNYITTTQIFQANLNYTLYILIKDKNKIKMSYMTFVMCIVNLTSWQNTH